MTNTREQYQSHQGRQAPEKAFKASTHVTELRFDSFRTLPRENEKYCYSYHNRAKAPTGLNKSIW